MCCGRVNRASATWAVMVKVETARTQMDKASGN